MSCPDNAQFLKIDCSTDPECSNAINHFETSKGQYNAQYNLNDITNSNDTVTTTLSESISVANKAYTLFIIWVIITIIIIFLTFYIFLSKDLNIYLSGGILLLFVFMFVNI